MIEQQNQEEELLSFISHRHGFDLRFDRSRPYELSWLWLQDAS